MAMDKPASSLTANEFDWLVQMVAELAAQGVSVIHISHKIDEVYRLCSRATILRDGRLVGQVPIRETPVRRIIELMAGRELASASHHGFATDREVLTVQCLTRGRAAHGASISLHAGEVLGIARLVGPSRAELLRLIAGVDRADAGSMLVEGQPVAPGTRACIRAGPGLVPEECKRDGVLRHRPITTDIGPPANGAPSSPSLRNCPR